MATDKLKKKEFGFVLFNGVSELDLSLSMRQLSLMLRSGMALEDGLNIVIEQASNKALYNAFWEAKEDIRSGKSLSESLKKHKKVFSDIVISIVEVGEEGGTLEKSLMFLSEYLKKTHELKKKVKGAMIYPMIVLSLTVVEMMGMLLFILPKMESLFASFKNLPAFTRFVLDVSKFIRENGALIAVGGIIFLVFMKFFLGSKIGKEFTSALSLNFPIVKKLTRANIFASMARTLSILLESGLPLASATKTSSETMTTSTYKKILLDVHENVKAGHKLSETLSKYPKQFDINFIKMIEVGEETGTLEENLKFLYEFYEEEVEDMSNNLSTLLEPILLIFVGLMIGVLAILIIGPIYQFTGTVRNAQ